MEEGACPRVDGLGVEPPREPVRLVGAARVAPAEDRRERVPVPVDGDEAVGEARGRVRLLVPEHAPDGCCDLGGIVGLVLSPAAARRPPSPRSSNCWARTEEEPMSSASTLIPAGRRRPSASHVRARSTFGPLGASRTASSWSSVMTARARRGSRSVDRLLDSLREPLGLDRERLDPCGQPLRGRLLEPVEGEDDREHSRVAASTSHSSTRQPAVAGRRIVSSPSGVKPPQRSAAFSTRSATSESG